MLQLFRVFVENVERTRCLDQNFDPGMALVNVYTIKGWLNGIRFCT